MKLLTSEELNASCPYALPVELATIRKLSDRYGPQDYMVMIGAGPAVFAVAMLEGRNSDSDPFLTIVDIDNVDYAEKHLFAAGCSFTRLYLKVIDSVLASALFDDAIIDFLIVDGDHSYEGVRRDIDAWLPKLRPNAKIFFHDYLERPGGFSGVDLWEKGGCAKAIDEDARLNIIEYVGISVVCDLHN